MVVGRKKKAKICDKGSHREWISKLPDHLIADILGHLPTKDAVRTSVLSTRWRSLWQCVPVLDLDSQAFSNFYAFACFADKFFDSHRESWIRRFQLRIDNADGNSSLAAWIDVVIMRRIQHLDFIDKSYSHPDVFPLSIYTCETLVHLRLVWAVLANAEFVSLPCLKILHLECIWLSKEATLEKLISASPVLEDLTILSFSNGCRTVIQVRSQTLKIIDIDQSAHFVIDAPLLQCLRTETDSIKSFKIINSGFPAKLDIYAFAQATYSCDILTDISRVRDLVITNGFWKDIFLYSQSGPLVEFRHLSRLNAKFSKLDLEMLPIILESCPKLESLIFELVKGRHKKKNREPKVMFSTVPRCLVSSLKFVELRRSISRCEGETELVRYFLKNSTVLEKLRLDISSSTKNAKCAFFKELLAMPRCSSTCEVLVL